MKTKIRIIPIIENEQFFVLEQFITNNEISEYRHGPFSTSFEADCYAEQRNNWLKDQVKPDYDKNQISNKFIFIFPPP